MALLKTQPDVRLLLPRPLVAGQIASFVVELDCPKPVPVDAVSLTLYGDIVWFTASQYGRHTHASRFLGHRETLLSSETELAAGKHRLDTQLRLSEELPASWRGDVLGIEYCVEVHVDIPWWPDKRATFVVRVADRGDARDDDGPMVYVSHLSGPPAKGPYLEIALGQPSVVPGGKLQLSAALGNVARNDYRKLQIELIARQSYPTGLGGHYVHDQAVAGWSVSLEQHTGELRPIPFSLDLPHSLVPAFELHGCQLQWLLQVTADVAWGVDPKLQIPLVVQPDQVRDEAEVAAPLAVGSDRLRLIWSKVARETGLEFVDDRLMGMRGAVMIEVRRDYEQGTPRVVGLLTYPDLGVGLRMQRGRLSLLGGTNGTLATRDDAQTHVVDELLGQVIAAGKHELLDATDQHLSLALDGAGAEAAPLTAFVTWLLELADRIEQLPEQLPAPGPMTAHVEAWRKAARTLGGTLRTADMCMCVERDCMQLSIGTIFDADGNLRATELELDPKLTIPTRQQLLWTGDTPLPDHELELDDLVTPPSWTNEGRLALHIEPTRVRVLLVGSLPDPMLEHARMEALVDLGRQLRGEQGPYR